MHCVTRIALSLAVLVACGDDGSSSASGSTAIQETSTGTATSAEGTDPGTSAPTGTGGPTSSATSGSSGDDGSSSAGEASSGDTGAVAQGRVHVVMFTHIEDNTPGGMLGTPQSKMSYLALREQLLALAELADEHGLQWVLQPDWKMLEAALVYEDAATTVDTMGKNFLLYLRDDLGVVIDPHAHENGGYNYPDVAHLLTLLEVGGSTVIGGHIWDPSLPQFQEWDRFRDPVAGQHYPEASWRGDILIGAGTPNHVNDPLVSGVWRPQDRDHFFTDDPAGNIAAVGAWHDEVIGVQELVDRYADATVPPERLLTASWNISPVEIMAPGGLAEIEQSILIPLAALRDDGLVVVTDFTTLVETWQSQYAGEAFLYQP
jgi:hypothetical protein